MPILTVQHKTAYRYANPVTFGDHRMMMRPRDSHDLRLVDTALTIAPAASVRWMHDVFGNSVAVAHFTRPARELLVESRFELRALPAAGERGDAGGIRAAFPVQLRRRRHPRPRPHGGAALCRSRAQDRLLGAQLRRGGQDARHAGRSWWR